MSLLGALPFVLSGDIPNYLDAVFETVSGFTTTGATILPQVEVLSRSCMFWRMLTQWIGGGRAAPRIFAVSNMVSTASFSTLDYTQWPQFTQWVLLMLMFVGACAGSTGGLKVSHFIMLVKSAASDVRRMIHPRRVTRIQLDGSRVESGTLKAVYTYFLIYVLIIVAGTMVVSLDGYDMTTNFTAALACISNIGPGMGQIGPASCFNIFSAPVKMVLAVIVLLGRLELHPILAFFAPTTWRK